MISRVPPYFFNIFYFLYCGPLKKNGNLKLSAKYLENYSIKGYETWSADTD